MKKLIALAVMSTALFAGSASAQGYVGIGFGDPRPDHGDTSWKAFAGTMFNPTYGLELAYQDFGKSQGFDYDAVSLAFTGRMPLDARFSLLGKIGAARMNSPGGDETNLLLGLGVGFALTPAVGLSLDYEDFGKVDQTPSGHRSSVQNLSLSLRFAF